MAKSGPDAAEISQEENSVLTDHDSRPEATELCPAFLQTVGHSTHSTDLSCHIPSAPQ